MTEEKAFEIACNIYAGYLSSFPDDADIPDNFYRVNTIVGIFRSVKDAALKCGIKITKMEKNPV